MLTRLMSRMRNAWYVLRRRGSGYLRYLLTGYLVPKIGYHALYAMPRALLRAGIVTGGVFLLFALGVRIGVVQAVLAIAFLLGLGWVLAVGRKWWALEHMQRSARARSEQAQATYDDDTFTAWGRWSIEAATRQRVEAYRYEHPGQEVVLGRIDNDGQVLGHFGLLPWLDHVSEGAFVERARSLLDVVLLDDKVLLRKDFEKDRARFVHEWFNLAFLYQKANVPAVYRVDETRCVLYKNLISGSPLQSMLVKTGAEVFQVQTEQDPAPAVLDEEARRRVVRVRKRERLTACVPGSVLHELEHQMDAIHACGMVKLSLSFRNIVVDAATNAVWFIDLEDARRYASTSSVAFAFRRDQDRETFNQIYGRNILTETSARAILAAELTEQKEWWYAPIDFGRGLTVGGFWTTDSGTGRWEFINGPVLSSLVAGKRVLDLGSNNGVMPIMMLREGAREVVGVERSHGMVERSKLVQRIFEWRDLRTYNFQPRNRNMIDILKGDWGTFDAVTAFCSLYYLSEEDMGKVVRKASEIAPMMVLQAKTDTRPQAPENKAEKSALPFLKKVLVENGYPQVEVYAPANYSRPLLVGLQP